MSDLITLSTAENYISTASPNTTLLASLISNVSQAIVRYCKRDFVSTFRDELYNGNGVRRLCLRHFPIISIQSVRYRPVTAIKIINNDTATNQQARAQIIGTGIQLTRTASGVAITETLIDFASHVTLIACANAINALGNGWAAQVVGDSVDYALWPSADLWIADGAGQGQGLSRPAVPSRKSRCTLMSCKVISGTSAAAGCCGPFRTPTRSYFIPKIWSGPSASTTSACNTRRGSPRCR